MTTENGLANASVVNDWIDALREREQFLVTRIKERGAIPATDWDRRELASLGWVIPVAEAERDHLIRVRRGIEQAGGQSAPKMEGAPVCSCGTAMVPGDDGYYCPAMESEMDALLEDHLSRSGKGTVTP